MTIPLPKIYYFQDILMFYIRIVLFLEKSRGAPRFYLFSSYYQ